MEAIAPVSRPGCRIDALVIQVKGIAKQGRSQLCQMNADLMGSSGGDGHLQAISLCATLEQHQFTPGFQSPPDRLIRLGQRTPEPAQQGMGPFNNIRFHHKRRPELEPRNPLGPGLIQLPAP